MTSSPRVLSAVGSGAFAPASEAHLARELAAHGDLIATIDEFDSAASRTALAEAEVLVTGWRTPRVDAAVLDAAPRLKWILHVAGSVKENLDDAVWERGITVSSAVDANAEPVAEFTLAAIIFANKRVLQISREYRARRELIDQASLGVVGGYSAARRDCRRIAYRAPRGRAAEALRPRGRAVRPDAVGGRGRLPGRPCRHARGAVRDERRGLAARAVAAVDEQDDLGRADREDPRRVRADQHLAGRRRRSGRADGARAARRSARDSRRHRSVGAAEGSIPSSTTRTRFSRRTSRDPSAPRSIA